MNNNEYKITQYFGSCLPVWKIRAMKTCIHNIWGLPKIMLMLQDLMDIQLNSDQWSFISKLHNGAFKQLHKEGLRILKMIMQSHP